MCAACALAEGEERCVKLHPVLLVSRCRIVQRHMLCGEMTESVSLERVIFSGGESGCFCVLLCSQVEGENKEIFAVM